MAIPKAPKAGLPQRTEDFISQQLEDCKKCLEAGAYGLAVVACGSIVEAAMRGLAERRKEEFKASRKAPRVNRRTNPEQPLKEMARWSVRELADVAMDTGTLDEATADLAAVLWRQRSRVAHPPREGEQPTFPGKEQAVNAVETVQQVLHGVARGVAGH